MKQQVRKQVLASLLAVTFLIGTGMGRSAALVMAEAPSATVDGSKALQGEVIQTDQHNESPSINENDVRQVPAGTPLELVLSTPLTLDVNAEGDEFFAKLHGDYKVDGAVVIPNGTIMHGVVDKLEGPHRAGRNGYVNTRFDYMITPDGREIPIDGAYSNHDSKLKSAAKVVGRAAGYTAVGGVVGALMVLKYGGLAAVTASNGYALAGGAAVGGAIGLTAAMIKKGHAVNVPSGSMLTVRLEEPLKLPTMNVPDESSKNFTMEGLSIKVLGMRLDKDPFGTPNQMTLTLDVSNNTPVTFSSFDIALEDENGTQFYPSPFGDSGMLFEQLKPNTHLTGNMTFNVDNPTLQHYLVFYKQYTREPLARVALTDAMQQMDKKTAKAVAKAASKPESFDSGANF